MIPMKFQGVDQATGEYLFKPMTKDDFREVFKNRFKAEEMRRTTNRSHRHK